VGIVLGDEQWPAEAPRRRRRPSRRELGATLDDYRVRAEADQETVRGLHTGLRQAGEEIADLHTRAGRLAAERDAAVDRARDAEKVARGLLEGQHTQRAQHAGVLVLLALMLRLQQAERTASLLGLAELLTGQPALPAPAERLALPAAEPAMPQYLPSGEHALVAGGAGLLLQLEDWISGPLPAGTNGTGSGQ
jgi:hypothetical protein